MYLRLEKAFLELAEKIGAGVAITPDAKGAFPEDSLLFIGIAGCVLCWRQ